MQVLKFVHSRKFDDVQTIGQDSVGFAFEQMLTLVGGDVRDGGKDIGGVGGGTLDAVAVIYSTLARLGVYIKELQIIVEIN